MHDHDLTLPTLLLRVYESLCSIHDPFVITVYIDIFAVDLNLISLFLRVKVQTAKLKTAKILFSNPHTNPSSVTGDQHIAIHVEAFYNAISSMHFHDDRACDSSLLRVRQLGSEMREIKTTRKFDLSFF